MALDSYSHTVNGTQIIIDSRLVLELQVVAGGPSAPPAIGVWSLSSYRLEEREDLPQQQVVFSFLIWVMGSEFRFSGRVGYALNHFSSTLYWQMLFSLRIQITISRVKNIVS